MEKVQSKTHKLYFERFSLVVTRFTGSSVAFGFALGIVAAWLLLGKLFGFSDAWQNTFDTVVTIITFLMVFIIQNSQNKSGLSTQLKLNEIVAALEGASNRLVNVEDMTEDELKVLKKYYRALNTASKGEENLRKSHSIEEATKNELKKEKREER